MKKLCLIVLLFASCAYAQSTHSVDLTWTASIDAVGNPGGIYTIYRAPGPATCVPAPLPTAFVKVGTALASLNKFTDAAVPLGSFCYGVTLTVAGAESLQSNLTPAVILPAAPTGLLVSKVN